MKRCTTLLLLLGFLIPGTMFSQDLAQNNEYKTFASSAHLDYMDQATESDLYLYSGNLMEKDKCRTYTKMKKAGLVMTLVGPIVMVGGVAMMLTGILTSDEELDVNTGLVVGGYVGIVAGALTTAGGIPLLIVGNVKSKQYCNGKKRNSQLNLNSGKNGVGVALAF